MNGEPQVGRQINHDRFTFAQQAAGEFPWMGAVEGALWLFGTYATIFCHGQRGYLIRDLPQSLSANEQIN